ncbi:6877_t:CDS:2 [Cetraspora pellucida]|uniref:6877_t:CDS:1 n=1 Tax=Cetraspora pellucida TaxID=1433469 RepID=A0A9N9IRC7_9GLOM|nr:6877_t:CDS:2 [Cetraspora pellucida]
MFKKSKDQEELSSSSNTEQVSDTEQVSNTEQILDIKQVSDTEQLKKEVVENKVVLFCTICRERNEKTVFAVGTTKYRLESIKNHIKTTEHKKSENLFKLQQTKIITNFAKQLGIDKLNIISLMRNVYFCAKNHQPINLFSNLCELVTTQIHNHKEYITSDRVYILKTPQYEKNKAKASYGSYMNNNSGNRFLDSICNIIEEDDKHLAIETNALYIFTQLKSFFESKNLNFNSLIYFGSDGTSTMLGHQSGVSAKLKNLNPFILSNHCIAHHLYLAGKDASLKDINDEPNLELQNHIKTRWLLLSNVVGNLYQIIDSILSTLNKDSLKGEKEAKNLILLLDENFVIVTMFLADLTTILKRLINVFQSDYVALSHLKPHLKTAISSISESFIGSTDIQPTYGIILCNYIDCNSINQETLSVFIEDYAKAIIEALQDRFPHFDLYNALSIFDVKLFPKTEKQITTYRQKEIEFLGNYYRDSRVANYNIFTGIIDKKKLLEEWNSAKFYLKSYSERDYNFTEI